MTLSSVGLLSGRSAGVESFIQMVLDVNIVVLDGFEPLDVFGPFEVFDNTDDARVRLSPWTAPV